MSMMETHSSIKAVFIVLFTFLITLSSNLSRADQGYLSFEEAAGIGAGSIGLALFGDYFKKHAIQEDPRWVDPPGIDLWFTSILGAEPRPGPRNFMDNRRGPFISTIVAGTMILWLDAGYPSNDRARDIFQNQFLYYSGALAQKGFHDVFKAIFQRQRPIAYLAPDIARRNMNYDPRNYNESFFSGHASVAFYSMTFLNKHVRRAMRREMSPDSFDDWNWLSPVISYSWATFVAYSRIHAYKHYFTDVLVGALAGWLIGELFYALGNSVDPANNAGDENLLLIKITVNI